MMLGSGDDKVLDAYRIVTSVRNGLFGPLSWIEGCA
jgi:hypothetical protein